MHIFISYAKKDTYELADELDGLFDSLQGVTSWMDRQLDRDSSWAAQIKREINRCDLFVVLISPDVNRPETSDQDHSFVVNEIYHAKYVAKKPMLVVMAQITELPLEINTRQYVDLTKNRAVGIDQIIEDVCEKVGIESPRQVQARQAELEHQARVAAEKASLSDEVAKSRQQKQALAKEQARQVIANSLAELEDWVVQHRTWAEIHKRIEVLLTQAHPYPELATVLEDKLATLKTVWDAEEATKPRPLEDILPAPFAWMEISQGSVIIDGKISEVEPFKMAKYPVTNAQFKVFVEAGGYEKEVWWTPLGWEINQREQWISPRYWNDSKFNGDDQPVVGISWYEALAFSQWLDAMVNGDMVGLISTLPLSNKIGHITLPTEHQWQWAAQGPNEYIYPWGNGWDVSKCNNSVQRGLIKNIFSPIPIHTTPVYKYEGKGDSFFGVVDMVGNVWEWSLTEYKSGNNDLIDQGERVLRGGSWAYNNKLGFCSAYRVCNDPYVRSNNGGMRLSYSY